ncbi:hypothetical protein [Priestia megaterium]|uniref:Uncharacterized protein n=1 Tax=Priestia megaterium TaxID=1404 RepID=A0A6M6E1M1_PRIMG|nr:hypothetical protein [Priestia megaterium]QJX80842.1 hypothetical protein FDZ14_32655 [Priestia megaterium]
MTNNGEIILAMFPVDAEKELKEMQDKFLYNIKYTRCILDGIAYPLSYVKGAWSLTKLSEKLPDGMGLGDIDGFLNFYGHLLFTEFKSSPKALKTKQYTALTNLVRQTGATVFMVFGEPCKPNSYLIIDSDHPYGSDLMKTNLEDLQEAFLKWCKDKLPEKYIEDTRGWDKWIWGLQITYAKEAISKIRAQYGSI